MMKKYFALPALVFLVSLIFAESAAQEVYRNDELAVSVLEKGVWVVETTDMTTMYIVEGEDRAVLIDTGTKCSALDDVVAGVTDKPLTVVVTHNHYDHIGNIGYFDEIYVHAADTVIKRDALSEYSGKVNFVNDGDEFDLGGRKLKAYLMPGHTPGSVVLVDDEAGIAFTSDAFGSGQVWLQLQPHIPMTVYIASCERMMDIMGRQDVSRLYPGHYPHLKRALGMQYMDDMLRLARKISSGDIEGTVKFGDTARAGYSPRLATNGSAQIVFNAEEIN